MKKIVVDFENPNGVEVDCTAEDIAQREADAIKAEAEATAEAEAKEANDTLKASAKAKLIAGEKLTEEEANILVGV
tara:strand:+ start:126 stop:353 length:228 start_codon:yes stop_codon:yes gene_type:complete